MDRQTTIKKIREIQLAILIVAKEVHKICAENDINYYMCGGTFIGAIRHKGFIPWDDDIDFSMLYDDFQKFIEIARNLQHPWLEFDLPDPDNEDYANMFIKVYDKRTTLVEIHKEKHARGVFVDIFPVIYAKDTKEECWKEINHSIFLRKLIQSKKYDIYPHRPILRTMINIFLPLVSKKYLMKAALKHMNKLASHKAKFLIEPDGTKDNVYKAEYFDDPFVLYQFEDTAFYGVKRYHEYLTDVYHDYMQMPPEEQRYPLHVNYFNGKLPYKEFLKNLI